MFLIATVSFVAAEESGQEWEQQEIDESIHEEADLDQIKTEVNNNQDQIPSFVSNIVGDERINVHFEDSGEVYGAELEGTEIKQLENDEIDDPTLNVDVDKTSLEAIIGSDQPMQEIQEQLEEGNIEYEALTTQNKILFSITETVMDILSRIGIT